MKNIYKYIYIIESRESRGRWVNNMSSNGETEPFYLLDTLGGWSGTFIFSHIWVYNLERDG